MEDPVRLALAEELRRAGKRLERGEILFNIAHRECVQSMLDRAVYEMENARADIEKITRALAVSVPQEQWVSGSRNEICERLFGTKSGHARLKQLEAIGAIEIKPIPRPIKHPKIIVRIIDRALLDHQPANWPEPS